MSLDKPPTKYEILILAHNLAQIHGEELTLALFCQETGLTQGRLYYLFGKWSRLREQAGLSAITPRPRNKTTKAQILELAREQARLHGEKLTERLFLKATGLTIQVLVDRCGSWANLREELGLNARAKVSRRYTDEELLEDMFQTWKHRGVPRAQEHQKNGGKVSPQTLRYRFGTWKNAQREYERYRDKKLKRGYHNPEFQKIAQASYAQTEPEVLNEDDLAWEKEREERREREWAEQKERSEAKKANAGGMPQWWRELDPISQRLWRSEAEKHAAPSSPRPRTPGRGAGGEGSINPTLPEFHPTPPTPARSASEGRSRQTPPLHDGRVSDSSEPSQTNINRRHLSARPQDEERSKTGGSERLDDEQREFLAWQDFMRRTDEESALHTPARTGSEAPHTPARRASEGRSRQSLPLHTGRLRESPEPPRTNVTSHHTPTPARRASEGQSHQTAPFPAGHIRTHHPDQEETHPNAKSAQPPAHNAPQPSTWAAGERSTRAFQKALAEAGGGFDLTPETMAEFNAAYDDMVADLEATWEAGLAYLLGDSANEEEEPSIDDQAAVADAMRTLKELG